MRFCWSFLLLLSGFSSLLFTLNAIQEIYSYNQLKISTPAKVDEWKIYELASGKFVIEAFYRYKIEKKTLRGRTLFTDPSFLNYDAAMFSLRDWALKAWVVWYDPKCVEDSSLVKFFPLKNFLRSILSLGIFSYFYFFYKFNKKLVFFNKK